MFFNGRKTTRHTASCLETRRSILKIKNLTTRRKLKIKIKLLLYSNSHLYKSNNSLNIIDSDKKNMILQQNPQNFFPFLINPSQPKLTITILV
jgi:hypothetical protein